MPWEFFDRSASEVETNISLMNGRADTALSTALAIIAQLGQVRFDDTDLSPPNITLPDIVLPPIVPPKVPTALGSPNIGTVSAPTFEDLASGLGLNLSDLEITIPDFVNPIGNLSIPEAPGPMDLSGQPTRPTVGTVDIPTAPVFNLPDVGDLAQIDIPDFVFPELPTFDGVAPTFDGVRPDTTLAYTEPVYASVILTEVEGQITALLAGGTGLPPAIQQALFDAARSREDETALMASQEAFDQFAGRGFGMPPGMLVKAVEAANEKARLAANTLERTLLTEAAKWEIENLRFAVQQGLAHETLLTNHFHNVQQRVFELAKARLDGDIKLFDAAVTLFNARQNALQVLATVFKIKTDAALATLEVFKARIQGAIAKGQLNEQVVRIYTARLAGVHELVEIFRARMTGAQVQSDIIKGQFEAYGTDVKAYGEILQARKTVFDAYDSRIKGETSKAQMLEALARAYGETVRGQEAKSNVKIRFVEAKVAAIRASIEKAMGVVTAQRESVQAQLGEYQARASAFVADTGRYKAEIDGANETERTELMVAEARLRNNLAYYESRLKEYDAGLERQIQRMGIIVKALESSGQISGTLAAGAMSAIHVTANMHGNATVSDSNSFSTTISRQGADVA